MADLPIPEPAEPAISDRSNGEAEPLLQSRYIAPIQRDRAIQFYRSTHADLVAQVETFRANLDFHAIEAEAIAGLPDGERRLRPYTRDIEVWAIVFRHMEDPDLEPPKGKFSWQVEQRVNEPVGFIRDLFAGKRPRDVV